MTELIFCYSLDIAKCKEYINGGLQSATFKVLGLGLLEEYIIKTKKKKLKLKALWKNESLLYCLALKSI